MKHGKSGMEKKGKMEIDWNYIILKKATFSEIKYNDK
jgi:hypothetical protein